MAKTKKSNLTIRENLERMNSELEGKDSFLGKDIMTIANKVNASRLIMFNSHLEQCVVLTNPEPPRVFTNYETMVGQYSSSLVKSKDNYEILYKIPRYNTEELKDMRYILIVRSEDGVYDVIERKIGEKLTESYAYLNVNDKIDSKEVGDIIQSGETLYHSTSFDEYENLRYGKNANVVYLIDNRTIEDAVCCSESFAQSMESVYLQEVEVTINNNDILCNIYGDDDVYKSFPDIGEHTKGPILLSRRRINNEYSLFDLQTKNLQEISYTNDMPFYAEGEVVDIDVFCNNPNLKDNVYSEQIIKYLNLQDEYYKTIHDTLKDIVEDETNTCSSDLTYLYRKSVDYLRHMQVNEKNEYETKWEHEKSVFDNLVIRFKVKKKSCLHVGSKLSNRFGGKGVISRIIPDDEMPVSEDGTRADIIFNALGICNRLNPGCLYELELNFMGEQVRKRLRTLDHKSKEKLFFNFIKDVNKEQFKFLFEEYKKMDRVGRLAFFQEIDEKGIYIHQPPFWNNVGFDELRNLYLKYNWIKPQKCYVKGQEIQNKLIIAPQFILKLKHEPKSKFSARSVAFLNNKNIPSKSLAFKRHQTLCSETPIRIGEMEASNLLLSQDAETLFRLNSMYSSNEEARKVLSETLIGNDNVLDIGRIPIESDDIVNFNRGVLNVYFKGIGAKLVHSDKKKTEEVVEEVL